MSFLNTIVEVGIDFDNLPDSWAPTTTSSTAAKVPVALTVLLISPIDTDSVLYDCAGLLCASQKTG
ncbi:hypothetical protein JCM19235_2974 [Vibrio maritimus]|uniref:Uncharacterized protein n=1 Tax=Vibrio maritimus TaxID=990268 RepID=A0A090S6X9_9VIBR|nr:hypothetical protein JCM19235_2974 [Vibrio maritimus]